MMPTLAILASVCVLSLLFVLVIPPLASTKLFMRFLPQDIRDAAKDHPDPPRARRILGNLLTALFAIAYGGAIVLIGAVGCFGLAAVCGCTGLIKNETAKAATTGVLLLAGASTGGGALWMELLYRAFSYDGKRQMSRQVVEGIANYVTLPEGGVALDVGCGSGALTIACAKRNPQAHFIGLDRWGKEYASYNKPLCEANARAESVSNTEFRQGDALRLDFPDESFDAVVSNYVYHNIPSRDRQKILLETLRVLKKGGSFALHDIFSKAKYGDMQAFVCLLRSMGYEKVELIDTASGLFMSPAEAKWMALSGSALLTGRK